MRFETVNELTTRKFGGSGLGLAITYSPVKMMNGDIKVLSQIGKGTRFVVSLLLQAGKVKNTDAKKATRPYQTMQIGIYCADFQCI